MCSRFESLIADFLRITFLLVVLSIAIAPSEVCLSNEPEPKDRESSTHFIHSVAPILSAKCVSCHRPDNKKGGLDMTTLATLLKGGDAGEVIVPMHSDKSPIYLRSVSQDGTKPEMPDKGEPLTEEEAASLKKWIEEGAQWPNEMVLREKSKADANFWSFRPIQSAVPPISSQMPDSWQRNPIDSFVYAKLAENSIGNNNPVTPRLFVRRATFDLHGMPPTPEQIEAFCLACDANGYDRAIEQLVDDLLASPRYGEQWGRHWLDVIRFGESRGYERNEIITNLWPFRDFVINSFNDDKPFNQLIQEHVAGDILGKDKPETEVGSAFLVAGPYDDVGNQDPVAAAQIRADQMDEMIRATSEAFLGLTIGCARCHDHKFDPILAKDYYSLYATFAGTVHGPREVATAQEREKRIALLKPLQESRADINKRLEKVEMIAGQSLAEAEAKEALKWTRPRISRYGTEEFLTPVDAQWVRLVVQGTDSEDSNAKSFKIDEFEVWTDEENSRNVALASVGAKAIGNANEPKDIAGIYGPQLTIDGKFGERWNATGADLVIQLAKPERIRRVLFSSDRTKSLGEDYSLTTFVGDYVIEVSMDGKNWNRAATSEDRVPPTSLRKKARLRQFAIPSEIQSEVDRLKKEIAEVDAKIASVPPLPVLWVGTHRSAPGPHHVFVGGDPQRKGDIVPNRNLSVLDGRPSEYQLDENVDEGQRRMALANWLTAEDNPLTPRVFANRIWQYHFGKGIVDTPSDFGYMGARPTHAELLDFLARSLIDSRWKIKSMHRLIMTSQTYRQSSDWNEQAARVDSDSRLLWRYPSRRLMAEEVRDCILSVAGVIDLKMGGPGFRLYEYQQDNVATYVPLDKHGPETYRRSVYHHNARAARVDLLTDFDCPDPAFADPKRASTTTPLQALTLMNHSFSLDMANRFSERLQWKSDKKQQQIAHAFELAFGREPNATERQASATLIDRFGLRAFCRAILNSNELIYLR